MLNLASLFLGLAAWGLGFGAAAKKSHVLSTFSFSACSLSLVLEFFEIRRRVAGEDWSALMDIVPSLSVAAAVLLVVTVLLNLAALRKKA